MAKAGARGTGPEQHGIKAEGAAGDPCPFRPPEGF